MGDLAESLRVRGWDVWWDEQLSSRTQFPTEIERHLNECRVVVAVWSRAAVDSRWVKEEANFALEHKKLLPVVIDGSHPPFGFQLVDTVNLEDWVNTRRSNDLEPIVRKIIEYVPSPRGNRPPLFGRRDELAILRDIAGDQSNESRIVLMAGEAGVGKTSLIREFRSILLEAGVRCLVAAGIQGASLPYQPLFEALVPASSFFEELPQETQVLLDEFLSLGTNVREQTLEELELRNRQLFIALTRAVAAFSQREPLALMFDDFQWFDDSSVSLIDYLTALSGSRADSKGPLFVISYRADALTGSSMALIERLRRHPSSVSLELRPLNDQSSRSLAEYKCGGRLTDDLSRRILSTTRGNPLFIDAVIEDAMSRNLFEWRHGYFTMEPSSTFRVPKDVAHIVEIRIEGLSLAAQSVMNSATVWGGEFGIRVLSDLMGMGAAEIVDALDELESAGFVELGADDYHIAHPLFQQIAYDRLSHARRQMLHARVASYLSNQETVDPALTASHMLQSGDLVDPRILKDTCRVAGERALAMYSWDNAVLFVEEYIKQESKGANRDEAELARAHHVVGGVYHRHGQPEKAAAHYETALSGWEKLGLDLEAAKVLDDLLRWHATYGSDRDRRLELVERCEKAIEALSNGAITGRLLETLATVYGLGADPDRARDYAQRALQLALDIGDYDLAARLSTAKALSYLQVLQPEQAVEAWEAGIHYADRISDDVRRVRCLQRLPMPYLLMGRFDDVIATANRARQLNYCLPRSGELSLALAAAANVQVLRGEWASVDDLAGQATELIAESGYYWAAPTLLSALTRRDVLRGNLQASVSRFELVKGTLFANAVEPLQQYVESFDLGDFTDAFKEDTTKVRLDLNNMTLVGLWFEALSLSNNDSRTDVLRLTESLEQARSRGVLYSIGWPYSVDRAIGVGYMLTGRHQRALGWFRSSVESSRQAGARTEVSISLTYAAGCERALGNQEDSARFESSGRALADELGMSDYIEFLTSHMVAVSSDH